MEKVRGLLAGVSLGGGGSSAAVLPMLSLLFATSALLGLLISMSTQGWAKITAGNRPQGECMQGCMRGPRNRRALSVGLACIARFRGVTSLPVARLCTITAFNSACVECVEISS